MISQRFFASARTHLKTGLRGATPIRRASSHAVDHHDRSHEKILLLGTPKNGGWHFWEPLWYIGYYGSMTVFFVFLAYSPFKSPTLVAKEEAHARLASRGEKFEYPLPPNYALNKK
ncbi:hypothetical protein DFJ73DRAFT_755912 [Zopfochytrium polystomum]|nr:hypothetical protein DFJ73DRAFT_755912 [Zopfochytrium polystomum]